MGEREALLAAIIADPDDDLPRLVYADWLEEHGAASDVARARLIRLQIELARTPDDDDRREAYKAECDRLIEHHWREWTHSFQANRVTANYHRETFRRGFLPYLCVDAVDLTNPALDVLLAQEPITDFLIRDIDTYPAIADWRYLPRVRELSFDDSVDRGKVRAVLRSPLLTGLRSLDGTEVLDEDDITLIATDRRFSGLTHLDIYDNDLPDRAVEVIARSSTLSRLTELNIGVNRTTIAALQRLVDSPLVDRLTFLGLRQYIWRDVTPGRSVADLLARFRSLQRVELRGQQIGDDGAAVLARSPSLSGLKVLRLGENALDVRGVAELLSSPHLTVLEELDLSDNPPGSEWVRAFATAGPRPLRKLVLENNELDARAVAVLAAAPALAGLRELALDRNPIGDRGAVALARSTMLSGLRKLRLTWCGITDKGAAALADSPALSRLERPGGLRLAGNRYSPETARRLRERFGYDPETPG